jgi:hypothetical protein
MKRLLLALAFIGSVIIGVPTARACDTVSALYATEKAIDFCLHVTDATVGAVKVESAAHASGDTYIMKDEGAEANTTNGFVDEGSCYSITLTATELTAQRIILNIEDQSTKTWADKCIRILTYGHASSYFGASVKADVVAALSSDTYAELSAVPGSTPTIVEMLQWVYQLMKFKLTQTATTATTFKDNGSTTLGTSTTTDDGSTFTRGEYN